MSKYLIFVSAPGLRRADVNDPTRTPNLCALAGRGWCRSIRATFPAVTSSVQATMWTGFPANRHGVVANGFYFRDRDEVEFWVGRNGVVQSEQIWNRLRAAGKSSAVWHAQNIKDAAADFIVTPEPIHEPDGSMKLWCYTKPTGLYEQLLAKLGHFPLQHYWGPMAGIQSSEWIVRAAAWLHEQHAPNLQFVYLPHLDYAGQKYGPDSEPALKALAEFDRVLGELVHAIDGPDVSWLVVSEYVMTAVNTVVFPNRMLREAGLLSVKHDADGRELPDLRASRAFAMVDHQFAHVYVREQADVLRAADVFRGSPAIESVLVGRERASHSIDHERSGEIVLITRPNAWLAYYWWLDEAAAPKFARTVDIHAKPGYDPVELFFDPATKSIPLNASLVKGSHGAPADLPEQEGAIVFAGEGVAPAERYHDSEVPWLISAVLGIE